MRSAAEQQRCCVRCNLTQDADVIARVIFKCRAGRVPVSRGGHPLGGINVGLCDERVEGNGQEHHAQQKCAACRDREVAALCSLFPGQQLNIRTIMRLPELSYSTL